MAENESPSALSSLKALLLSPRGLIIGAVVGLVAAAGAFGYWNAAVKPEMAAARARFESHKALMRLYALQIEYRKTHSEYAQDLDALLMGAPDAAQLRDTLRATVDMSTLAIIGGADKFRLEANVLDPQRTLVKFRGPTGR